MILFHQKFMFAVFLKKIQKQVGDIIQSPKKDKNDYIASKGICSWDFDRQYFHAGGW
jgi:hypothetical protein